MVSAAYVVTFFDPLRATCDLRPEDSTRGGFLYQVPIVSDFGGSEDTAKNVFPEWEAPEIWGEYEYESDPEGIYNTPRWGVQYPIQPGDIAIVQWENGDPLIIGFTRLTADVTPAVVALGFDNFYSENTPTSVERDRYDLLLPTGAWQTSHFDGSWTTATPPVHNARNFISQFADGRLRVWARTETEDDYELRMDFDPNEGKIVVETIPEGNSTIKFTLDARSGDVTLTHTGKLNVETGKEANLTAGGDMTLTAPNIYLNP